MSDFDYTILLSLERAKLIKRSKKNALGTKELVLDYQLQNAAAKEGAIDWLDANRLTLTDPKFSFKTYTGTWKCISIDYNEDTNIIRQRFQIDSSLIDDVYELTTTNKTERSYYWRVTNPDDYDIPVTSPVDGVSYRKSANDNGDGTYDVIIEKVTATSMTGTSYTRQGSISGTDEASDSIFVSNADIAAIDGEYEYQGLDGSGYPYWIHTSGDYSVQYVVAATRWELIGITVPGTYYYLVGTGISNLGWYYAAGSSSTDIVIEIGRPGNTYDEEIEVTVNSTEQSFVSDGGSIADPVSGENKTIQNVPIDNGLYRTTVITRTARSQRLPALYSMLEYYSPKYNDSAYKNGIIAGSNRTQAELMYDILIASNGGGLGKNFVDSNLHGLRQNHVSSVSVSMNQFGRLDYTIMTSYRG